jgi:hypothetical protein
LPLSQNKIFYAATKVADYFFDYFYLFCALKQNKMNNTTISRITSVDAYRGFVMLLMMGEVLSFSKVSEAFPTSGLWQFLTFHRATSRGSVAHCTTLFSRHFPF